MEQQSKVSKYNFASSSILDPIKIIKYSNESCKNAVKIDFIT